MTARVRTQKKIYTPTTIPEPECFLCQVIETQEYVIVHRSSMKRIYGDSAEIMVYGRRTEANIVYRGAREDCVRIWRRKDEAKNLGSFDDEVEGEDDDEDESDEVPMDDRTCSLSSKTVSNSSISIQKRSLPKPTTNVNNLSTTQPAKRMKCDYLDKEILALHDGNTNDDDYDDQRLCKSSVSSIVEHMNVLISEVRQENQKHFVDLSKKIERKSRIDDLHGSQNLLSIRGRNIGDYARSVLRALYSNDELLNSILPPGGAQFCRKPLDSERFEKLHDALRIKYNISQHRYDEFFRKLVRPKLVDFLCDERKRAFKNESTRLSLDSERSS